MKELRNILEGILDTTLDSADQDILAQMFLDQDSAFYKSFGTRFPIRPANYRRRGKDLVLMLGENVWNGALQDDIEWPCEIDSLHVNAVVSWEIPWPGFNPHTFGCKEVQAHTILLYTNQPKLAVSDMHLLANNDPSGKGYIRIDCKEGASIKNCHINCSGLHIGNFTEDKSKGVGPDCVGNLSGYADTIAIKADMAQWKGVFDKIWDNDYQPRIYSSKRKNLSFSNLISLLKKSVRDASAGLFNECGFNIKPCNLNDIVPIGSVETDCVRLRFKGTPISVTFIKDDVTNFDNMFFDLNYVRRSLKRYDKTHIEDFIELFPKTKDGYRMVIV